MSEQVLATATVRVPASTSNLGAGFDCVGLAIDRWMRVTVELLDGPPGVELVRRGTLRVLDVRDDDAAHDLIVRGFHAIAGPGWAGRARFVAESAIPVARGLGSSGAALLAGAALANAVLKLGRAPLDLARACLSIEGHPDNLAPAALGGAVLVARTGDSSAHFSRLQVDESLAFAFAVPDFEVQTSRARAALPATLPFAIAAQAASRAASLVQGLRTGDAELLAFAFDDVLHVPCRRALVPHLDAASSAARDAGAYGATLSGSGSSIVAVAPASAAPLVADAMAAAWRAHGVEADSFSTRVGPSGLTIESTSARSLACP
ncbi:MAG TPA: homoserine kinase [Gemmatimonadaceae bacterium]|nr:homoserine kinase [Gemmatimonadaceae bacterium]